MNKPSSGGLPLQLKLGSQIQHILAVGLPEKSWMVECGRWKRISLPAVHCSADSLLRRAISECRSSRKEADQQDDHIAIHQPVSQAVELRCSGDTAAKTIYKNIALLTHKIWEEERAFEKVFQHTPPAKDHLPHESWGEEKNSKRQGYSWAMQAGPTICMAKRKQAYLTQKPIMNKNFIFPGQGPSMFSMTALHMPTGRPILVMQSTKSSKI